MGGPKRNPDGTYARTHHPWSLKNFDDGYVTPRGRFNVYCPSHPRADSGGYLLRSIAAYEAYHPGVTVTLDTVIHHNDEDKLNDSRENLILKPKKGPTSHAAHHQTGKPGVWRGVTDEKHPLWKGDDVLPDAKYQRALKARKRAISKGQLTPEIEAEFERAKTSVRESWRLSKRAYKELNR